MRWLMIGLLASLGVLLLVAVAAARHIWLHRANLQRTPATQETDLEP